MQGSRLPLHMLLAVAALAGAYNEPPPLPRRRETDPTDPPPPKPGTPVVIPAPAPELVDALGRPLREEPLEGTFSSGPAWPASDDPIADINAACGAARRATASVYPVPSDIRRLEEKLEHGLPPSSSFLPLHDRPAPAPARAPREKRRSRAERKERNRKRKQRRGR